ncbi:MAG: hypothetical protein IT368_14760 [Candidatus Hydrogenedentes bacterium]|nr:hypothetical protein [Candidatus Hydrogenedentota bacterium]
MSSAPVNSDQLYEARLRRYVAAMHNKKPDRVPLRPFLAEFTAVYAGYTCQQVTHDYPQALAAARQTAAAFDFDAVVGNMVYVWTGLTQAIGLKYYGVPGIHVGANVGFQYLEPPEDASFMNADEYDALIADPTGFLFNTWLPRVCTEVVPPGTPATLRNNLSFLKGGMAMMEYFGALGAQGAQLRSQGMPSAIAGILKAPLDILGDKLRGYMGLMQDLFNQPEKVRAACEALAPHLAHIALTSSDLEYNVPCTIWMHRGGVPFVRPEDFENCYWPTLRPILDELWQNGHQVLLYGEGDWSAHLERFAELPDASIIFHCDRTPVQKAQAVLGDRFCLSGGLPNNLLAYGTPEQVRDKCKELIDIAGRDGGYVMDASAIVQNDGRIDNIAAMVETTREYGVYGGEPDDAAINLAPPSNPPQHAGISKTKTARSAGVCFPWEEKRQEIASISGDEALVRRIWEQVDSLGHTYIWHLLVSF